MTVVNISTEYLSIMNLVLMKNLVAKLLIYVSQLCSAVERNTSSFFLFEVNLPNKKKITKNHQEKSQQNKDPNIWFVQINT